MGLSESIPESQTTNNYDRGSKRRRAARVEPWTDGVVPFEMAALGMVLFEEGHILRRDDVDLPTVGEFFLTSHNTIFGRMVAAYENCGALNVEILADELNRHDELEGVGGRDYLCQLTEGGFPGNLSFAEYVKRIKDAALGRRAYGEYHSQIQRLKAGESPSALLAQHRAWLDRQAHSTPKMASGYNLTSLDELFQKPDTPVDYVWNGRLVAGTVSCCVAKPKVGKGTFARNLSLAVARGDTFLGAQCQQGEVVYLALEEREEEIKADFRALGATGNEPIYIHAAPAPAAAVPELILLVRKRLPRLLVVDPVIRVARIRDQNAYAETYEALGPLIDVARECGTHILLLHHSGKGMKADAIDSPLGSTAFAGVAATLIYLKRLPEGYRTIQTVQRIGDDCADTVLNFDKETKQLTAGITREEREQEDAGKRILAFLALADTPKTQQEIRDGVEGAMGVLRAALTELTRTGRVIQSGEGKRGKPHLYSLRKPPDFVV